MSRSKSRGIWWNWLNSGGGGVSAPSTQATSINFWILGPTVATLRWTNGNGSNRIVVVRQGGAVDATPSDNTTYAANTAYGSGDQVGTGNYVVYNGTGSEVSITGLSENTAYHVRVFEYNGSAGSEKYNTDAATGNPANETTILDVFQYAVAAWELQSDMLNKQLDVVNHGDTSNNVTYSSGANFTGTNSYITVRDHNSLSFTDDTNDLPFSVEFEATPTNFAATRWIVSKRGGSSSLAEWQVAIEVTTGKIYFSVFSQGGTAAYLLGITDIGLTVGVKNTVRCWYDANHAFSGLHVAINGTERTLTNSSVGTYVRMSNTTGIVCIAGQGWNLTGSSGFVGKLARMRVYRTALTSGQRSLLENSGNGVTFRFNYDWMTTYHIYGYVHANRGNYILASDYSTNSKLWWSSDRGKTWDRSYAWATMFNTTPVHDRWISFSHIFEDGTVIFATAKTMYRSTDGLATVTNPTIKGRGYDWSGADSDAFVFHTPVDPTKPGTYFMQGANAQNSYKTIGGQEVLMWTNYANVSGYALGAAPVFIWATNDNGATIQAVHCWGVNPNYKDDGSNGGGTTGTDLGDSGNSQRCRHGHQVAWIPGTDSGTQSDALVVTGDFDTNDEIHWLRVTYDESTGLLTSVNTLINDNLANNRYYAVGLNPSSDGVNITWSTDVPTGGTAAEMGIWRNAISSISSKTGETRIKDLGVKTPYGMIIQNSKAIVIGEGGDLDTKFGVVEDSGAGAVSYIAANGKLSSSIILAHLAPVDSYGFVKMNLGGFTNPPSRTIYHKP